METLININPYFQIAFENFPKTRIIFDRTIGGFQINSENC